MLDAIYYTIHLGHYMEMAADLKPGQHPLFGLCLDQGSRYVKTKTFCGFSARWGSRGEVYERIVGFERSPGKAGIDLLKYTEDVVEKFNEATRYLQRQLGRYFPGKRDITLTGPALLKLINLTSLGIDGANVSPYIHINKRILKHNPRCMCHHCCLHRGNLLIKQSTVGNRRIRGHEFMEEGLNVTVRLYKMVNSSDRVKTVWMDSQEEYKEYRLYNVRQPLANFECPMYGWESEDYSLGKIEKSYLASESTLRTVKNRRWDRDPQRVALGYADWLLTHYPTLKYVLYIGIRKDLLAVVIGFMKSLEYCDTDVIQYIDAVKKLKYSLNGLVLSKGGSHYKDTKKWLLREDCRLGHWDQVEEFRESLDLQEQYDDTIVGCVESFIDQFDDFFGDDIMERVAYFRLLSMKEFRAKVTTEEQAWTYGEEDINALVRYFCYPQSFTSTWTEPEEEADMVFTVPPLVDEGELREGLQEFKRCVFDKFMGNNQNTEKPYTTKDVLDTLLKYDSDYEWIQQGSAVRVYIDYYRTQCMSTASVERLFSTHSYVDHAWNQATTDEHRGRLVTIYKDLPRRDFDLSTAVHIFHRMKKTRRVQIPPPTEIPTPGKILIKPLAEIVRARELRRKRYLYRTAKEAEAARRRGIDDDDEEGDDEVLDVHDEGEQDFEDPDYRRYIDNEENLRRTRRQAERRQEEAQHQDNERLSGGEQHDSDTSDGENWEPPASGMMSDHGSSTEGSSTEEQDSEPPPHPSHPCMSDTHRQLLQKVKNHLSQK